MKSIKKNSLAESSQNKIKRALAVAGKEIKGSLTIEASLVLPIFMLFFTALISLMVMISLQLDIQAGMEETARSIGKKAYIIYAYENGLSGKASDPAETKESLDSDTKSLMSAGINAAAVKLWLLSDKELSSKVENSDICGGAGGLYTHETTFDEDSGILDMVVYYDYKVPWLPSIFGTIRFVQRSRSHVWTGVSINDSKSAEETESRTVYITPTGTVYHLSASCSYLDLSIRAVSVSEVASLRNKSGGKYEQCSCCKKVSGYTNVYVTDYGTNYHASLSCSGLKRTVMAIDISEAGSRRVCSKCKAGSE